ncbi:MAG: SUMF1/EgtB/PvdO family nonheme iron enzyme, partial [Candidatus Parabeggiatoa sp.]|nr:SUMF1/EgtB/PvdO family nonheme iron enzyme [Candidatus Parabeggiatoa sp.]
PGMAKQSNTPSGTLIAYAAAPGRVALSGEGQDYSPYVESLMKWLPRPNLSITDALTQVRNEVKQATYEQQEPEYTVALDNIFYLNWDNRVVENYRTEQDQLRRDRETVESEQARLEAEKEGIARDKVAIAEDRARLQAEKHRFADQQIITPRPPPPIDNRFVAGKVFRDRLQDGSDGPEMVRIPAGTFRMGDIQGGGDDDEQPVHTVSVKRFAMGRYEITFADYDRCAKATGQPLPDYEGWGRGNRPVINVSWNDVTAYAEWLSEQTGQHYRLPTEAEWEYAARAGTSTRYWWGNTASHEYANYGTDECCDGLAKGKDRWKYTSPVGSFAANPFGLYDTAGNVWEWTCSEYEDPYNGKEKSCLSKNRSNDDSLFVLRGGSWFVGAMRMRSSFRGRRRRADRFRIDGVRLARRL